MANNVKFRRGDFSTFNSQSTYDVDAFSVVKKVKSSSDTAYSRLYIGNNMVGCGHTFAQSLPGLVPEPIPSGSILTPEDLPYIYLKGDGTWGTFQEDAIGACSSIYLPLSGGTMSGNIDGLPTTFPATINPSTRTRAASVGMLVDNFLNLDGSSAMQGDLDMGSNSITHLDAPTDPSDAATKKYVDDRTGNTWATAESSAGIVDGTKTVQWLYAASGGTSLSFQTDMEENTTCHLFIEGGNADSFGSGSLIIKHNLVPRNATAAGPTDTVIIDNVVKYHNGAAVDTTDKTLSISANQILEISVMYTTVTIGSTKYYRTVIKTLSPS